MCGRASDQVEVSDWANERREGDGEEGKMWGHCPEPKTRPSCMRLVSIIWLDECTNVPGLANRATRCAGVFVFRVGFSNRVKTEAWEVKREA